MYHDWIIKLGGPKEVEDLLFDSIDEDIKVLQGQVITPQRLQQVKGAQPVMSDRHWWQSGGYLDFITDDRDIFYQRYYVGQSTNVAHRVNFHITAMLYGDTSTLHYYIHTLGGGHRASNFIRLFNVDKSDAINIDDGMRLDKGLMMNMLEMTMTLAFQSLPRNVLEIYLLPNVMLNTHPTIHLNVANPLFQVTGLNQIARESAREAILLSTDSQMRSWFLFRKQHLSNQKNSRASVEAPLLRNDFLTALKKTISALNPQLNASTFLCPDIDNTLPLGAQFSVKDQIKRCAESIRAESGHEVPLFMPIESLKGSIAIIHGQSNRQREDNASITLDERLPFGLRDLGLSAENSLIWSIELHKVPPIDIYNVPLMATLFQHYQEATWSILSASLAKVVLLCGIQAHANMSGFDRVCRLSLKIFISLRDMQILIRLEYEGESIRRIFFYLPDLQNLTASYNWHARIIVRFALQLAAIITDTIGINFSLFEQHSVQWQILHDLYAERNGMQKMTVDTINENVRR